MVRPSLAFIQLKFSIVDGEGRCEGIREMSQWLEEGEDTARRLGAFAWEAPQFFSGQETSEAIGKRLPKETPEATDNITVYL
jgi:hypothetical protein